MAQEGDCGQTAMKGGIKKIKIKSPSIGEITAEITDENPQTVADFLKILPISAEANLWGEEIYFKIPLKVRRENSRVVVKEGEIGIWVEDPSLCIFFGKTPVSQGGEIRAYSEVNVIGKIIGDPEILKKVQSREMIVVELL